MFDHAKYERNYRATHPEYREHERLYRKKYNTEHREERNAQNRTWREKNPERAKEIEQKAHAWRIGNKEYSAKQVLRGRIYRAKLRKELYAFFGDKCQRCGFNDPRALQIDHINRRPASERKDGRGAHSGIYNNIRMIRNDPETARTELQLLCANCQWIKRVENHEYSRWYDDVGEDVGESDVEESGV